MVYDRKIRGQELNFEASGALKDAALIMRDVETDSWWSIMTKSSIGGPLEGSSLLELPSEKTTWRDWVSRHPDTLVLSEGGVEHIFRDGYADYHESADTYGFVEIDDQRLRSKEPIFAFRLDGRAYAAAHRDLEGGRIVQLEGKKGGVFLYREEGASRFASTSGFCVPPHLAEGLELGEASVSRLEQAGAERLNGFDTYWYTWILANADSELLR